jgi:hypothetical protein
MKVADRFSLIAVCALPLLAMTGCEEQKAAEPPKKAGPSSLAVPAKGAYTGAYIEFGDYEDEVTLEGIEDFEKLVGKHQAIIASSSYWGKQSFPAATVRMIFRHGSIPLIFWSPWDDPYLENKGPDKFSLRNILKGDWDAYIDRWAEAARDFSQPIFVSFCNEMNGDWFPWSGTYYGGGKVIANSDPARFEGPELFKQAYRHVVDRVRAKGATNILWVFHVMNYGMPQEDWNYVDQYYPGPDYVDWLGMSVYGQQFDNKEEKWAPFPPLLEWPYNEICALDPDKPIMLAEWGVGEFPRLGNKAEWIKDGFEVMKQTYPRIKAAVYWHERWENDDGSFSNLRVNSSPETLDAYRKGVADPHWLADPILEQPGKPAQGND